MSVSIKLRQRGARTEKEYTDELEQHGRDCGGHIAGLCWRWRWWTRWFHDGVGCRLHGCPLFLRHDSQSHFSKAKTSPQHKKCTRTSKQILRGRCVSSVQMYAAVCAGFVNFGNGRATSFTPLPSIALARAWRANGRPTCYLRCPPLCRSRHLCPSHITAASRDSRNGSWPASSSWRRRRL